MTDDLARRLDHLSRRGPHAEPRLAVARAIHLAHNAPTPQRPDRYRPTARILTGAVAAASIVAAVAVLATRDTPSTTAPSVAPTDAASAASPKSPEESGPAASIAPSAEPTETLPPTTGEQPPPVTVPAGSPLVYFRLLPDLDVSQRETGVGSTELCWRTPAGEGCIDDAFNSPDVGAIPATGGVIFLARPALVRIEPAPTDSTAPLYTLGPEPISVTAHLSDGSTSTVRLEHLDTFGPSYARLALPEGITVVEASSQA